MERKMREDFARAAEILIGTKEALPKPVHPGSEQAVLLFGVGNCLAATDMISRTANVPDEHLKKIRNTLNVVMNVAHGHGDELPDFLIAEVALFCSEVASRSLI